MKVYEEVSGVLSLRHFGLAGWCSLSSPACFLSDISGWRDGALYPLAGGGRRIRRGAFWLRRRDAARPARADGEAAGGAVEISVLVNLVRGDDGARAVGATDDDASPVRRGASYGVSFATTRSQQLAEGSAYTMLSALTRAREAGAPAGRAASAAAAPSRATCSSRLGGAAAAGDVADSF